MKIVIEAKDEFGIIYSKSIDVPADDFPSNAEQLEAHLVDLIKSNFPDIKVECI